MQAVLVIPEKSTLQNLAGAGKILTREVAGVPLLIRVVATAMRADVDNLLIVWPPDVNRSMWDQCGSSHLLRDLQIAHLVRQFDPRQGDSWSGIAETLQELFYWLPWNWVTHKRALAGLVRKSAKPDSWDTPALLEKQAICGHATSQPRETEGVLITSENQVAEGGALPCGTLRQAFRWNIFPIQSLAVRARGTSALPWR